MRVWELWGSGLGALGFRLRDLGFRALRLELRVWVRRLKTVFEPERFVGSPEGFCSAKGLLWAPGFRVLAEDGVVVFAKDFVPLMGL